MIICYYRYIFMLIGADKTIKAVQYIYNYTCIFITHVAKSYVGKVKDFAEIIIRFKVTNFLPAVRVYVPDWRHSKIFPIVLYYSDQKLSKVSHRISYMYIHVCKYIYNDYGYTITGVESDENDRRRVQKQKPYRRKEKTLLTGNLESRSFRLRNDYLLISLFCYILCVHSILKCNILAVPSSCHLCYLVNVYWIVKSIEYNGIICKIKYSKSLMGTYDTSTLYFQCSK